MPRFFALIEPAGAQRVQREEMVKVTSLLNAQGYWPAKLEGTSHPFRRQGQTQVAAGDFSQTTVGDDTDTSPYSDDRVVGISTAEYVRSMSVLIRFLRGQILNLASRATGKKQDSRSDPVTWTVDSLGTIGGHAVTVAGTPRLVDTPVGAAVEFNGRTDGLFLNVNPLAGLARFSVEVMFEPAANGPEEQRFVHFEEAGSTDRALIELRMPAPESWYLDTYLRDGDNGLTFTDRSSTHPASRWHVAALTYDGHTMAHYVDGARESSGALPFSSLGEGRTSIGVRQDQRSWFKGRIHLIRITPDALPADRLMRHPEK